MSDLLPILKRHIRAQGPLSLADYMSLCLTHPEHGYYTNRTAIGAKGDFITAPEISQMFGEMLGLSLAHYWMEMGAPSAFTLAELGPGRGTLMADILRATRAVPGFHQAMTLALVELSPKLRDEQSRALRDYDPIWVNDLTSLGAQHNNPLLLVANEFFDALPIRQFIRSDKGWTERVVGIGANGDLQLGLSPECRLERLEPHFKSTQPGDIVQMQFASGHIDAIGRWIAQSGGCALVIDYGDWQIREDTFQAVCAHAYTGPLESPGHADLTTHVDFSDLSANVPDGCLAAPLTSQGDYLNALGIAHRAQALAAGSDRQGAEKIADDLRRLTDPAEMGSLFKVFGLYKEGHPLPPGFGP